ncbi:hypothetical protein SU5_p0037 (plasmid) [Salmonella enterica subsp. enterica serovar Heidelberg str. B182]|nr:hypothetical protein SU5_p0037 [Salmonella enterica subsp. enterica serovar Heidelberg str. B182]
MLQLTEKMGFMIMPVTASFCWPTRSAVLAATKNERKIPQMKGKKRKYSQTTGTKNPTGNRAFLCFPALSWWLWLEWNCLQPTPKNNRYDRQCKSKYRESAPYNGVNG